MKIGRNDPCPCGSGKKYKHCCLAKNIWDDALGHFESAPEEEVSDTESDAGIDTAVNQAAMAAGRATVVEYKAAIESAIDAEAKEKGRRLTFPEVQAVIRRVQNQTNGEARSEFFGLSSDTLFGWLTGDFGKYEHCTISVPQDLSQSPVMRYLELLIAEARENDGRIKLTEKGNLPLKFIAKAAAIRPELKVARIRYEWEEEFSGKNEDTFFALAYTRHLADLAKITYVRTGALHVKKDALKAYEKEGVKAFFMPMLEAAVRRYNWDYGSPFPMGYDFQQVWLFMVWRLSVNKSVVKTAADLTHAFPDLVKQCAERFPENSGRDTAGKMKFLVAASFVSYFLERWGFVDVVDNILGLPEDKDPEIALMPMFAETFKFDI